MRDIDSRLPNARDALNLGQTCQRCTVTKREGLGRGRVVLWLESDRRRKVLITC